MLKLNYPKFWQYNSLLSYILLPLSLLYWLSGKIRTWFAVPIIFPAKVICVGNITVGGTGKTQIIKSIARHLNSKKTNFIILVRSYRANLTTACVVDQTMQANIVGDEALELSQYGTVIATKYFTDSIDIINHLKPDVILVDDGMQNPYFKKDIQIIAIDGTRKFGNHMLIPAGPMRQSLLSAVGDIAVIIGNQDANIYMPYTPCILHSTIQPIHKLQASTTQYVAFTGIGNSQKFFFTLKNAGYILADQVTFPDHHQYSQNEIEQLIKATSRDNMKLITTEKDIVKLPSYADKIEVLQVHLDLPDQFFKKIDELLCN